jgi:hypothetical protein
MLRADPSATRTQTRIGAPKGMFSLSRLAEQPTDETAMKLLYLVLHPRLVVMAGLQDVPE